ARPLRSSAISDNPQNTDLSHIPFSHLPVVICEPLFMGGFTLVTKVVQVYKLNRSGLNIIDSIEKLLLL
ncbi:MAG: hypothetical protein WBN36_04705, partial [Gammaproteobacteria bacterium]